jgi:hypothetical protein
MRKVNGEIALREGERFQLNGKTYEVTFAEPMYGGRIYVEIPKPGATNALGRVTNKGAIDVTEGVRGYAEEIGTDSSKMIYWGRAIFVEKK